MWFYLWILIGSSLIFVVWAVVCAVESRSQKRILLPRLRAWLDKFFVRAIKFLMTRLHYVSRYFFALGWYYGIHTLLKTCLRFIANTYFVLEYMFEKNRARTKQLRREQRQQNPYFTELTEHKSNTALTKSREHTLKKRALEGK